MATGANQTAVERQKMKVRLQIKRKARATHTVLWRRLYQDWSRGRIESFELGDLIPASSMFLDSKVDEEGQEHFRFLIYTPRPRNILTLEDLVVSTLLAALPLELPKEDTEDLILKNAKERVEALVETVFKSEDEKEWWNSVRKLNFELEVDSASKKRYTLYIEILNVSPR